MVLWRARWAGWKRKRRGRVRHFEGVGWGPGSVAHCTAAGVTRSGTGSGLVSAAAAGAAGCHQETF